MRFWTGTLRRVLVVGVDVGVDVGVGVVVGVGVGAGVGVVVVVIVVVVLLHVVGCHVIILRQGLRVCFVLKLLAWNTCTRRHRGPRILFIQKLPKIVSNNRHLVPTWTPQLALLVITGAQGNGAEELRQRVRGGWAARPHVALRNAVCSV